MWNFKETRTVIDKAGWQYTKNIADEYGQSPRPKAYDDVSLPRSAHKSYNNQPRYPPPSASTPDEIRDLEMRGYAVPNSGGDPSRTSPVPASRTSPRTSRDEAVLSTKAPPEYAKVNKNRDGGPEGPGQDEADSWV